LSLSDTHHLLLSTFSRSDISAVNFLWGDFSRRAILYHRTCPRVCLNNPSDVLHLRRRCQCSVENLRLIFVTAVIPGHCFLSIVSNFVRQWEHLIQQTNKQNNNNTQMSHTHSPAFYIQDRPRQCLRTVYKDYFLS